MNFHTFLRLTVFLFQFSLAFDEDFYHPPSSTNKCPNTKPNQWGETQDLIRVDKHKEIWCCLCNRGYYMDQACNPTDMQSTVCLPCPPNTYMDEDAHFHRRCKEVDGFCREDQDPVFEPTHAPKCFCKYGFFNVSDEDCQQWKTCSEGYGVSRNGTRFSDVICKKCPEVAGLNSSLKLEGCPDNAYNNHDNGTPSHDEPVPDCPSITIGGFLLGFFVGLICAILGIYLLRKKLCRKHKVSSSEEKDNNEESNESLLVE